MAHVGKFLAATVLITAAGLAVPAQAAEVTFNFEGGCSVSCGLDGTDGNVRTFTAVGSDGITYNVRATAWTITGGTTADPWNTGTHTKSFLGHYSGGLGVTSPGSKPAGDGTGGDNLHTTDNLGSIDYVLLQFDALLTPTATELNAFQTPIMNGSGVRTGWYTADNDATILIGDNPVAWNAFLDMTVAANRTAASAHMLDINTNASNPDVDINPGRYHGTTMVVSADMFRGTDTPDGFKIGYMSLETLVPEPAAVGLLGLGIAGLVGLRRRRRG